MNFLNEGLGELLIAKLGSARKVQIASAFFCPSDDLMDALKSVPGLELVVSEEFTINHPYKLEELRCANLRSIPTDHTNGKLHAKVFIVTQGSGSDWVLIGSANLTYKGLFSNQEACIELCSELASDTQAINYIREWYRTLFASARKTDLEDAKRIFNERSRYRLEKRPTTRPSVSPEYWAIKTTSGGAGAEEHWSLFQSGVVAIGWEELDVDPSIVDDNQLRTSLARILDPKKPGSITFGVRIIRRFINMPIGSILVVCRGLVPKQTKPVHIYAFARITGPFRADPLNGTQWRFKREAVIQEIGEFLPADVFAAAIELDSCRMTMHELQEKHIQRLADALDVPLAV